MHCFFLEPPLSPLSFPNCGPLASPESSPSPRLPWDPKALGPLGPKGQGPLTARTQGPLCALGVPTWIIIYMYMVGLGVPWMLGTWLGPLVLGSHGPLPLHAPSVPRVLRILVHSLRGELSMGWCRLWFPTGTWVGHSPKAHWPTGPGTHTPTSPHAHGPRTPVMCHEPTHRPQAHGLGPWPMGPWARGPQAHAHGPSGLHTVEKQLEKQTSSGKSMCRTVVSLVYDSGVPIACSRFCRSLFFCAVGSRSQLSSRCL